MITLEEEMLQHLDGLVATDLQSFQEMQRLEGRAMAVSGGTDYLPCDVGAAKETRDDAFSY